MALEYKLSYTASEINKKLDEIDELQATVDDFAKPDWNQSDETANDFIKNKPFYDASKTFIDWDWTERESTECATYKGSAYYYKVGEYVESKDVIWCTYQVDGVDEHNNSKINVNGTISESDIDTKYYIAGVFSFSNTYYLELFFVPEDNIDWKTMIIQMFKDEGATDEEIENASEFIEEYAKSYPSKKGIWYKHPGITGADLDSLHLTLQCSNLKQLDEKYIPDTVARTIPGLTADDIVVANVSEDNTSLDKSFDELENAMQSGKLVFLKFYGDMCTLYISD